uniref:Uncharacterized protein n=1 Tax=Haptolina ericina TaxID=156174 RepID=A0A7S3AW47_9EUKA|mmetsp:Transcript_39040/g.88666  ORF Transcript_39040/g.88666 Transcript_39040/m.88666 type:complete len:175 (+) Transcript_39040:355-879(+)
MLSECNLPGLRWHWENVGSINGLHRSCPEAQLPPPPLASSPFPMRPPPAPSPSPLFSPVIALRGNTDNPASGVCIASPTATTTADGAAIAAQCCTASGECKRMTNGRSSTCIAGVYGQSSFVPMTFTQAEEACTLRGLVLCDKSCAGKGCTYNQGFVWTGLSCASAPPPASSPT